VRAGETSGALDTVLLRLAKHLEWSRAIKATATHAPIDPSILVCALVVGYCTARRRPRGAVVLAKAQLAVPKFGRVARQLAVSRFAATASVLQEAGCNVFTLLNVAGATCGNAALAASFSRVSERVRRGQTITHGLDAEPNMDSMLVQMVAVGELTGELDRCLSRLAAYYDDVIPRTLKRFLAVLEPSLLAAAGALVAVILLAARAPIFKLYETMG